MLSVVEDELIVMGDKVIKEYDDKILNIQEQAQIKMVRIILIYIYI